MAWAYYFNIEVFALEAAKRQIQYMDNSNYSTNNYVPFELDSQKFIKNFEHGLNAISLLNLFFEAFLNTIIIDHTKDLRAHLKKNEFDKIKLIAKFYNINHTTITGTTMWDDRRQAKTIRNNIFHFKNGFIQYASLIPDFSISGQNVGSYFTKDKMINLYSNFQDLAELIASSLGLCINSSAEIFGMDGGIGNPRYLFRKDTFTLPTDEIDKLVIIGNGFDLQHGYKTKYKDFAEYIENHQFIEYAKERIKDAENWYDFENVFTELIASHFSEFFECVGDVLSDNNFEKKEAVVKDKIQSLNNFILDLSNRLMEYLEKETEKDLNITKQCFLDELRPGAYCLNFNYTNTVYRYTNLVEFVHGSISHDKEIIFGAVNEELPCYLNEPYNFFSKDRLRERLSFRRFIRTKNLIESELAYQIAEFEKHLSMLFSGRGGYDYEYDFSELNQANMAEETNGMSSHLPQHIKGDNDSDIIFEYASNNNFRISEKYNFRPLDITELVIMGHGLESDRALLDSLFRKLKNTKVVILYTHEEANPNHVGKQVSMIKSALPLARIQVRNYY